MTGAGPAMSMAAAMAIARWFGVGIVALYMITLRLTIHFHSAAAVLSKGYW